ncbi:MAG: hypothetical protein R3D67_21210 [Hyphomicrobiaceae bacterium]
MTRLLAFNRPARKRWSKPRRYRVCVNDMAIYAKVFTAYSPRHALKLASIDTERNRDWRSDWQIIATAVVNRDVTVTEVRHGN